MPASNKATLFVCTTCGSTGRDETGAKIPAPASIVLAGALATSLHNTAVQVTQIACLSQCTKPHAWALAAPGKETLAFHSALVQATVEDIATTALAYAAHAYLPRVNGVGHKFKKDNFAPTVKGTLSSRVPPLQED